MRGVICPTDIIRVRGPWMLSIPHRYDVGENTYNTYNMDNYHYTVGDKTVSHWDMVNDPAISTPMCWRWLNK